MKPYTKYCVLIIIQPARCAEHKEPVACIAGFAWRLREKRRRELLPSQVIMMQFLYLALK